jgi:manganese oxidase
MHMHGFHFEVVASDGRPLPRPYLKDTLSIGPGERYDLLVTLDQLGSYPFHSHVLLDNTNDGAYPGGIHTMVTVRPPGAPLDVAGHEGHAVLSAPPATPAPPPAGSPAAAPGTGLAAIGGFPTRRPPVDAANHEQHAALAAEPPDGATVVEMRGDRFHPERLVIEVGTTVAWVNADPRTHALAATRFASPDIPRNRTWAHTFGDPGVYLIECVNHRGMKSVVTVR